ncbi:hypothetical protein lerEdw1_011285 [Lerista edwardsae]|nr:hypothetical protein lerEdw1_011285 [Lerista edwardsae]
MLSDANNFPTLYQMAPKETIYYEGLVQLLLHFTWTWVGIVSNDVEERFVQKLQPLLDQNSICVAFIELVNKFDGLKQDVMNVVLFLKIRATLLRTKANVIILDGERWFQDGLAYSLDIFEQNTKEYIRKVWIVPPEWSFTFLPTGRKLSQNIFDGALSVRRCRNAVPGFKDFLHTFMPGKSLMDFLHFYSSDTLHCHFLNETQFRKENCTREGNLEIIYNSGMTEESFNIYNGIYAIANALHAIHMSREKGRLQKGTSQHLTIQPWQLHSVLKNIHFNNGAEQEISFEKRHSYVGFDIINHFIPNNASHHAIERIGEFFPSGVFTIRDDLITWNKGLKQVSITGRYVDLS